MNISQLKESKFLKKEDVGPGMLLTIASVSQENVAKEGAEQELKWVLHFQESEKPMVLNSTNGQLIAKITGSDETDDWQGHKVVLYEDPNISFAGKIVGGIRVRAPRGPAKAMPNSTQPQPKRQPLNEGAEPADDVPF